MEFPRSCILLLLQSWLQSGNFLSNSQRLSYWKGGDDFGSLKSLGNNFSKRLTQLTIAVNGILYAAFIVIIAVFLNETGFPTRMQRKVINSLSCFEKLFKLVKSPFGFCKRVSLSTSDRNHICSCYCLYLIRNWGSIFSFWRKVVFQFKCWRDFK